jgi:hypothetical protein
MTREEILHSAGQAAPVLMQKAASILAQLELVDPLRAERLATEMGEVVDYTVEKVATTGYGPLAQWGTALGTSIVGGVALSMAGDLYDAAKRGLTETKNFNAIMKANPELKAVDKKRLRASFDALHRYAPELTSDPLVGGSLLKSVAEVPGNEAVVIKDIISSRKNLVDAKFKQFRMNAPMLELPSKMDVERERQSKKEFAWRKSVDVAGVQQRAEESKARGSESKAKRLEDIRNKTQVQPLIDMRKSTHQTRMQSVTKTNLPFDAKKKYIAEEEKSFKKDLQDIRMGRYR